MRTVVADRVVGGLTRNVAPDVLAVRPLVVPAIAALVNTEPFRRVFAHALSARHRALINGDTSFSFELRSARGCCSSRCRASPPGSRTRSRADLRVPILRLDPRNFELTGARVLTDSPACGGRC